MKLNISKRDRKLLIGAAVAVVLYFLLNHWFLPFYDSLSEAHEKIAAQEKRVMNYRRIMGGKNSVNEAMAAAKKQLAILETGLLAGQSDALASAEIQGLVKNLVISTGMTFRRSDTLPVSPISPEYGKVPTRVEIVGSIEQFHDLMINFTRGPKHLVLDEVKITPTAMGGKNIKSILLNLVVSGIRRMDSSPPSGGKKR
jgi:Tfp pilus assembly protein PilO